MSDNILLLQGPVGPFFRRLSRDFQRNGHRVFKINFNGGDRLFYRLSETTDYRGTPRDWPEWLTLYLKEHDISRIYLFGDSRFYHRLAKKVARELGIQVFVFECGYIRPDYVTLEPDGVNGNSAIPRDPAFYRDLRATPQRREHLLKHDFLMAAFWVTLYYWASTLGQWRFRHYQHHRPLNPVTEGARWAISGVQKIRSVWQRHKHERSLYEYGAVPYFFVPLQVHNDAQVRRHSAYRNIEQFIEEVVTSFAISAPANTRLLIKHHPMDRAYRHYGGLITKLQQQYGLGERLIYLHDLHLPTVLHYASGTVTINSTVGLSALHHRTPVKTLGDAIYDMPGLTHQGSLAAFWHQPGSVDGDLYSRFRAYLLRHNQLRGSLYQPLSDARWPSGLAWPTELHRLHLEGQSHCSTPQPARETATPLYSAA